MYGGKQVDKETVEKLNDQKEKSLCLKISNKFLDYL